MKSKRVITKRFVAQYDITYPFILLMGDDCSTFERRRFTHFTTYRQQRAFIGRFRTAWRGYPSYAEDRGFKP